MDDYLDAMQAWRPAASMATPAALRLLAAHAEARGVTLTLAGAARGVHDRRAALPAPAGTDRTGLRRAGGERIRQPRHRLHRARDAGRADAADERKPSSSRCWTRLGQPVARGEAGRGRDDRPVLRQAQPFIRYRTGDMVRLSARAGRGGPWPACASPRWRAARPISSSQADGTHHACAGRDLCAAGRARASRSSSASSMRCRSQWRCMIVPGAGWNETAPANAVVDGCALAWAKRCKVDVARRGRDSRRSLRQAPLCGEPRAPCRDAEAGVPPEFTP